MRGVVHMILDTSLSCYCVATFQKSPCTKVMAVPELNTSSLWQSDAVAVLAPLVHLMPWLCSGKTVCVGLAAAKQAVGIEPGMVPCCGESEPGMVRFAGKPDAAATVALQPLNI